MLFYFFLFLLFLSDIFISDKIPQLNFYLVLVLPIALFFIKLRKKEKILLPKVSIFFLLFLVFSGISVIFAIDKQVAFEAILVYISAFFLFILSFNNKKEGKKYLHLFIICSSVFFLLLFIVENFFNLNLFTSSKSLFYTGYHHLQIGNFIALGVLASLTNFPYLFFPFLLSVLLSYSRSAYLSLILVLPFFARKKIWLFVTGFFLLLLFLLVTSGVTFKQLKQVNYLRDFLVKKLYLSKEKKDIKNRFVYISYAISSFIEKPLFGVGPGNFYYAASKRQLYYNENTTTAHNILLDVFAENGIFAGASFFLFFIVILLKAKKNNYLLFFLFLTLIFLFDFSYRFNSFLVLWFVLVGLLVEDNSGYLFPKSIILGLLLVIFLPVILGAILFKAKYYQAALLIYPLRKETHYKIIEEELNKKNKRKAFGYIAALDKIFGEDASTLLKKARYYDALGKRERAIYYHEKKIDFYPFSIVLNGNSLDRILALNISLYGRYLGRKKTAFFLNNILIHINKEKKDNPIVDRINGFCQINNVKCYNY